MFKNIQITKTAVKENYVKRLYVYLEWRLLREFSGRPPLMGRDLWATFKLVSLVLPHRSGIGEPGRRIQTIAKTQQTVSIVGNTRQCLQIFNIPRTRYSFADRFVRINYCHLKIPVTNNGNEQESTRLTNDVSQRKRRIQWDIHILGFF